MNPRIYETYALIKQGGRELPTDLGMLGTMKYNPAGSAVFAGGGALGGGVAGAGIGALTGALINAIRQKSLLQGAGVGAGIGGIAGLGLGGLAGLKFITDKGNQLRGSDIGKTLSQIER